MWTISELSEDWASLREPVIEGVPFYVKYLGSSLVQKASGEEATSDAIRTIIAMVNYLRTRCFSKLFIPIRSPWFFFCQP